MAETTTAEKHAHVKGMSKTEQYVVFMLGNESYGIDILQVQEIMSFTKISQVPNTPIYVKGVINLRGDVIPVVDMRLRFGLPSVEYTDTTVTIVVNIHDKRYGLIVDGVSDVSTLRDDTVQFDIDFQTTVNTNYIVGIATDEDSMVIILDTALLFSHEELAAIETKQSA